MKIDITLRGREKGFVAIYATLTLFLIVPLIGLAIDLGAMYLIRTKLSAAADAAVLAGARALNRNSDIANQLAANTAAQKFFNANFPSGFWGTGTPNVQINIDQSVTKMRTVRVQASVDAPLYFMRVLGGNSAHIAVDATSSRRDVNLILVLDRSGSLQIAGACGTVKSNATSFVNKFTGGRDQLGLLTFAGGYSLDYAPSMNFKSDVPSMADKINQMQCGGWTGSAQALWQAYQQLVALNQPGALNVIVFFTDGRPTALTGNFPVKQQLDTRYDSYSTSTLVLTAPSTCWDWAGRTYPDPSWNPGPKLGFIASYPLFPATGTTRGVYPKDSNPLDVWEWAPIADSNGCAFQADRSTMRTDIANIPETDFYGNSTDTGYKPVLRFSSGPYNGLIRPDSPQSVRYAAYNAAEHAARRIRLNTSLGVITFAIGLGGTETESIDHDFLKRVSNDIQSPTYDPTVPTGLYVYAPTPAQLNEAFVRVASAVIRLSM